MFKQEVKTQEGFDSSFETINTSTPKDQFRAEIAQANKLQNATDFVRLPAGGPEVKVEGVGTVRRDAETGRLYVNGERTPVVLGKNSRDGVGEVTNFAGFTFKHFDGEWHVATSTERGASPFTVNGPVPGTFGAVENQAGGVVGETRVLGIPKGAETTAGSETPRTNSKETNSSRGTSATDGPIVYGAVTTPGALPGTHGAIVNLPGGVVGSVSVPETVAVAPYTTPRGVVIRDSVIYTPRSVTEQELKKRGITIQNTGIASSDVQSAPQVTPEQPAAISTRVAESTGRSDVGYATLRELTDGLVSQGLVQPGDVSLVLRKADPTSSSSSRIDEHQARLSLACIIAFGAEAAEAFNRGGYAQLEADGWIGKVWDKPAYRQVYGG